MIYRKFWKNKIEERLEHKSIVWLTGVRRIGKTFLCKSFEKAEYFDCEIPRVRRLMEDPESFLSEFHNRTIILDEIHRLPNPSELLKIAADHFGDIKIIATGSSSLSASVKFKDTLTGRKTELWLTPMVIADIEAFGITDMRHRMLYGGLPPFFLAKPYPERDFREWVDSYWAKDIQELFRLERHHSFQKFFELIMTQSGGIFEATGFSVPCEISRTTVVNYLKVLEATFAAYVVRPFSSHKQNEITSAPKVYGFDTGFVCYYRGWHQLREEDMGFLWEHIVLNEIYAYRQVRDVLYWRDKQGHEVDFIVQRRGNSPIAIECKWRDTNFDFSNLRVFLRKYKTAEVLVVCHNVKIPYSKKFGEFKVNFIDIASLTKLLGEGVEGIE